MSELERSLFQVLKHEGGYVNHPKDPGGETNKGITKAVYDDYRKSKGLSTRSVKHLEQHELEDIYRARYWNLVKGDKLPVGVSYAVFDGAVNSGVSQSAKWLQRALGVKADGIIGPATIAAINAYPSASKLIDGILDQRMKFLRALKTWPTFGRGWTRRVDSVRVTAKKWAIGVPTTQDDSQLFEEQPKAYVKDVQKAPSTAVGDTVAGAGASGFTITQAISQLDPIKSMPFASNLIMYLTIASVVIGLAGAAYGFYARRRKAEVKDAISSEPT